MAEAQEPGGGDEDTGYHYDSWALTDGNFEWLVDTDGQWARPISWQPSYSNMNSVTISSITSFRGTDVESWITSDGRAYLVQLIESDESEIVASHREMTQTDENVRFFRRCRSRDEANAQLCVQSLAGETWHTRRSNDSANSRSNPRWQGSCIHDVQVPKWVQKRKQVHPDEETDTDHYEQPRRAVKVVVNMKFSLVAVGTQWSVVFWHNVTYALTHIPLVAMSSTRAFLRSSVYRQNLKY